MSAGQACHRSRWAALSYCLYLFASGLGRSWAAALLEAGHRGHVSGPSCLIGAKDPLIRPDDRRGTIAPWVQDGKPLLGLGHYQHRSYWAAVTHRHLVCFASALLTHLRIERTGAQGQRTRQKAADLSTAAAQDQLRRLLWDDLIAYLKEKSPGQPVIEELERLRVALLTDQEPQIVSATRELSDQVKAHEARPAAAARWSAVRPSALLARTSAPRSSSRSATSMRPDPTARWSGVFPSRSAAFRPAS